MILGRFEEAKKILDQWRQKGSLSSFQIELRYRIAFFENDAATMERLAREIPADDMRWLGLQQQLAFFRGDFSQTPFAERNAGEPTEARETDGKRCRRACLACPA